MRSDTASGTKSVKSASSLRPSFIGPVQIQIGCPAGSMAAFVFALFYEILDESSTRLYSATAAIARLRPVRYEI